MRLSCRRRSRKMRRRSGEEERGGLVIVAWPAHWLGLNDHWRDEGVSRAIAHTTTMIPTFAIVGSPINICVGTIRRFSTALLVGYYSLV